MDWNGRFTTQFEIEHLPKVIEIMKSMAVSWKEAHDRIEPQVSDSNPQASQ